MTVGTKEYCMYNTISIVSVSANYFYYRYVKVSGTEKVRSIGKTHCRTSTPIKYTYSL